MNTLSNLPPGITDQMIEDAQDEPEVPHREAEGLAPIYVASRASLPERGQMWREFRGDGVSISSSWIDEDGEGESQSLAELWTRIANEIHRSVALVLYAEQGDFPLKGALIEAGIALGQNKPIVICLPDVELDATSMRPIGSWVTHPLVRRCDDIDEAVKIASSYTYLATRATVPTEGKDQKELLLIADWLDPAKDPPPSNESWLNIAQRLRRIAAVDKLDNPCKDKTDETR